MYENRRAAFAVPVKLVYFFCSMTAVFLTADHRHLWIISCGALILLLIQRRWKLLIQYTAFYSLLCILLYAFREYSLRMVIFSEFHVYLLWWMTPIFITGWDLTSTPPGNLAAFLSKIRTPSSVILGLLVIFRFFPTMHSESKAIRESMHNRRLTGWKSIFTHPLDSFEYILVPLMLSCLNIADQLSISAVTRGIESPSRRTSYYHMNFKLRDVICIITVLGTTAAFLTIGGIK